MALRFGGPPVGGGDTDLVGEEGRVGDVVGAVDGVDGEQYGGGAGLRGADAVHSRQGAKERRKGLWGE